MKQHTIVKKDPKGVYIVVDDWIVRPFDNPSDFAPGNKVWVECPEKGGVVRVRGSSGNRTQEVWAKKIPYWWHPIEGDNPGSADLRKTNLRDSPNAYAALNDAFLSGECVA